MARELDLLAILGEVAAGRLPPLAALDAWQRTTVAAAAREQDPDATGLRTDLGRAVRLGFPEVVYGPGKPAAELEAAVRELLEAHGRVMVTRVDAAARAALAGVPDPRWHERARILAFGAAPDPRPGTVGVLAAGTADLAVAEEAAVTAEAWGLAVRRFHDVGVAGLHRLLARREEIEACDLLIVVAGMEGALPSVVGGLYGGPVIAVPTSVGYGTAFDGLTPLLAQLSGCAPGVVVVNIDNGFGAGYAAGRWMIGRAGAAPPRPEVDGTTDSA
ncbi:MAG: nickel pincer cofactor biosynthesis protein LarB [Planctomycetota bacterium]